MPIEEKRKLLKEFKEDMKQQITTMSQAVTDKALEPIRRNLRTVESDMIIENKKLLANVDAQVKQTILNFDEQKQ
jgi:hypothetical protein